MINKTGKTDFKLAVILNKKVETGILFNACAHMMAALSAKGNDEDRENMMFIDYMDADGGKHLISALSLIVLKADNSNKIRKARNAALEKDILFVDFTESMTKNTYIEQMERTRKMREEELEYWGLSLFGSKEDIDSITRKFSLWR